jgi:hypothetical protein
LRLEDTLVTLTPPNLDDTLNLEDIKNLEKIEHVQNIELIFYLSG